jgi:hypothetical protein
LKLIISSPSQSFENSLTEVKQAFTTEVAGAVTGVFTLEGTPDTPRLPPVHVVCDYMVGWFASVECTKFYNFGLFLIVNHKEFHYIKRVNRTVLWITIFYLMSVAFISFSTALLGEYGDQQISVIIYGISMITESLLHTKNHAN